MPTRRELNEGRSQGGKGKSRPEPESKKTGHRPKPPLHRLRHEKRETDEGTLHGEKDKSQPARRKAPATNRHAPRPQLKSEGPGEGRVAEGVQTAKVRWGQYSSLLLKTLTRGPSQDGDSKTT